jgi:hypothetical protein
MEDLASAPDAILPPVGNTDLEVAIVAQLEESPLPPALSALEESPKTGPHAFMTPPPISASRLFDAPPRRYDLSLVEDEALGAWEPGAKRGWLSSWRAFYFGCCCCAVLNPFRTVARPLAPTPPAGTHRSRNPLRALKAFEE